MIKDSDQWETPKWLFDQLHQEFNFIIDVCATEATKKLPRHVFAGVEHYPLWHWLSVDEQRNYSAFCNPPYSNPKPFVELCYFSCKFVRSVLLLKCDPSTKWWAIFWDHESNKPREGVEVRFLPKRLKFERNGIPGGTANFPSAIVIMDRRHVK